MKKRCNALPLALALATWPALAQFAKTVNDTSTNPAPPWYALNVVPQNDGGIPTVNTSHYALYETLPVRCPTSGDLSVPVANMLANLGSYQGGIVDARMCTAATAWTTAVTITQANAAILLPCATITATHTLTIAAGIRNVSIHGCSYLGSSATSGIFGGTVWNFQATGPAFTIGDPTYAADTPGFEIDNMAIATGSAATPAQAFTFYRAQEIHAANLYLLGNNSTGMTAISLDGTGNYTGGHFENLHISGFATAIYFTGHLSGSVVDDYANASTFVKMHIDCSTSGGSPIAGTYGFDLSGGDGNTIVGGDVEGCAVMTHFGAAATDNTITGLRNENSTMQYVADAHSKDNAVIGANPFFQGKISDAGFQNSFQDSFHRSWNGIQGDWYASLIDSTITNEKRLGIGLGNERGLLDRAQTDYGYRWTWGLTDGSTGLQTYDIDDTVNAVHRVTIAQYLSATANTVTNIVLNDGGCYSSSTPPTLAIANEGGTTATGTAVMVASSCAGGWTVLSVTMTNNGTSYSTQPGLTWTGSNQLTQPHAVAEITTAGSTNNETAINAAGTGAVVLNGGTNSGTGGFVVGSGGATPTQVMNVDSTGNQTLYGDLHFFSSAANQWSWDCNTSAVCELHNDGASTPANVIRAFPNAATEIDSQGTSDLEVNATSTGGTGGFSVYGGGATYHGTKVFAIQPNGSGGAFYLFPTLAAGSGDYCAQFDTSGYLTNTGAPCGTGTGSGTVNSGTQWSPAYYATTGTAVSGVTPFSGLEYWPGSAPPQAATAAQIVAAIGSTPVQAANGAPPTGACAGDLSGTQPNCTVAKIEGGSIPASANFAGYNSSHQPVAAPNTLGCIDGYDHLPCVVFQQTNQSITATQSSYAQVWPASSNASAGIYRTLGYVFATAAGTCTGGVSATAEMFVKATQNGGTANGWAVASAQIAATSSSGSITASPVFNIAASTTAFNVEVTLTCTGSVSFTANPTVSYALTVERIQ